MHSAPHESLSHLTLDHVAVAVPDLEEATAPYRLIGLSLLEDSVVEEQGVRVRMLEAGGHKLELLEPLTADSPVALFLKRRGPGLHHVAFRVEGLEAEIERLASGGARFTSDAPRPGHGGSRVIFVHPKWTGGVLVELIEAPLIGSPGE